MSIHLSKCHIVRSQMSGLICKISQHEKSVGPCFDLVNTFYIFIFRGEYGISGYTEIKTVSFISAFSITQIVGI